MSITKRTGLILVGVAIGAIGTSSLGAAREQAKPSDASRLTVTLAPTNIGSVAFVKDTKSEGCWFVFTKGDSVAVAPAPISACNVFD